MATILDRRLLAEFAADVRRDLALEPKQLQSKYLYDALGSSLFDAICNSMATLAAWPMGTSLP